MVLDEFFKLIPFQYITQKVAKHSLIYKVKNRKKQYSEVMA